MADYEIPEASKLKNRTGESVVVKHWVSYTAPGSADDETEGFTISSSWLEIDVGMHFCTDPTTGAAVWFFAFSLV